MKAMKRAHGSPSLGTKREREEDKPTKRKVGRPPSDAKTTATAKTKCKAATQMGAVSLDEFFQFMQCSLKLEAKELMGKDVELQDPAAQAFWDTYLKFVTPNLGANERWVPYHTVLGLHEKFLMESVHHRKGTGWNEKQRFLACFIFRAHCKCDVFTEAELPHMLKPQFWKDPIDAFRRGGPLEKSIRDYRKKTGKPLQTLCFRIIPERILKDNDENLVLNLTLRTQRLLEIGELAWEVLHDKKKSNTEKFNELSRVIQEKRGLGETWAKMMMVVIDLAMPKLGLLASQCEVGTGARMPLVRLLEALEGKPVKPTADAKLLRVDPSRSLTFTNPRQALEKLAKAMNSSKSVSSGHFWDLLMKVEGWAREAFKHLPLALNQLSTKKGGFSAVTVQVQLCEYRQFRTGLARIEYGLPEDHTMTHPEIKKERIQDVLHFDKSKNTLSFDFQKGDYWNSPLKFEVDVKLAKGSKGVATRIAAMCYQKLGDGGSKKDVEALRAQLYDHAKSAGDQDVAEGSEAWETCRITLNHSNPLCSFMFDAKNGPKIPFQTTLKAVGGNMVECERIARLCYAKFQSGAKKDEVQAFREGLYKKCRAGVETSEPAAKRQKTSGGGA